MQLVFGFTWTQLWNSDHFVNVHKDNLSCSKLSLFIDFMHDAVERWVGSVLPQKHKQLWNENWTACLTAIYTTGINTNLYYTKGIFSSTILSDNLVPCNQFVCMCLSLSFFSPNLSHLSSSHSSTLPSQPHRKLHVYVQT